MILIPVHYEGAVVAHAAVEDQDAHLAVYRWRLHTGGYAQRTDQQARSVYLHREVLGLVPGDGLQADHIDGDRLNCRRSNLRIATPALNAQNRMPYGPSSRHRGVSWNKRKRRWSADVKLNGRASYLGLFDSEEAAAAVATSFRLANMPYTNEGRSIDPRAEAGGD